MRHDAEATLLLSRADVASLVDLGDVIEEVERAFACFARGSIPAPGILSCAVDGGGFHVKSAWLPPPEGCFAVKANANFPGNRSRSGRPTIQGVIVLFDGEGGFPLAVMDSIEITMLRTAAATAVAARHCARASARTVTIAGCGDQARAQLLALACVRPLARAFAYDIDSGRAQALADSLAEASFETLAVRDLRAALAQSDICVTCTPSHAPFVARGDLAPGTFVAAVGADSEGKQELAADLVASSAVIVDLGEQCASIGELHHALDAGLMTLDQVRAELGEVVTGKKPGRISDDEIVIFDSTGTALQDVATASLVYERAVSEGFGTRFRFARYQGSGLPSLS
jgi:ornithine cyclodeaminase/alanine dehydrogenase-like protein (mu-crystallin family)